MDWKKSAIEDLIKYNSQKQSLDNIRERIGALQSKLEATKGTVTDKDPVQGGMSQMEDRLLDNIVERERLKLTYHATERLVKLTEKGLSGLDEKEKRVLDLFFISRTKDYIQILCDELGYEERNVYNVKCTALYKFTVFMYGLIDY